MSEITPVVTDEIVDQEKPSMSMDQIRAYAQNMMRRIEQEKKVKFFDHWITKLGLDPVVANLEAAHIEKSKVRAEKLKRRGKRN